MVMCNASQASTPQDTSQVSMVKVMIVRCRRKDDAITEVCHIHQSMII
jgi:hypothetical protein